MLEIDIASKVNLLIAMWIGGGFITIFLVIFIRYRKAKVEASRIIKEKEFDDRVLRNAKARAAENQAAVEARRR